MSTSKTIYLARHAKSSWDSGVTKDFGRPLSNRGQKDAVKMGNVLNDLDWKPEKIISSPALRAHQTCLALCKGLGISADTVVWSKDFYAAYMVTLLQALTRLPEQTTSVMLIGHNPSIEDLLLHLCGDVVPMQNNGKLFTTGNVVKISIHNSWSDLAMSEAEFIKILRPKAL